MTSTRPMDAHPSAPCIDESAPLLDVQDLSVQYRLPRSAKDFVLRRPRKRVRAVDGVTFSVASGQIVALVGESGCGKTSTAQSIIGMTGGTGSIHFLGQDITRLPNRRMRQVRRNLQLVYQDPYESLDPRFRVRATVEEPLLIHGIGTSPAQREDLVLQALTRAGLNPPRAFLDRYPHELSGGQRQRVAIAAALVLQPRMLVADEPVSMLDVSVRAGILQLLADLRSAGMGILMITHDLATAAHYADRIEVMYLGRIVERGPAREVVRNPQHPYTRALISAVPRRDPLQSALPRILPTGEAPSPVAVPSGCRFHPRCPLAVPSCRTTDPSLTGPESAPASDHQAACVMT